MNFKFSYIFYLLIVLLPVAAYFAIKVFHGYVVDPRVIGDSNFKPIINDGDHILFERWSIKSKNLKRGDIVLINLPDNYSFKPRPGNTNNPQSDEERAVYLKQIIAIPGDRIEIKVNDAIYVNGKKLERVITTKPKRNYQYLADIGGATFKGKLYQPYRGLYTPIVVPHKKFFVISQDANDSFGSNVFGFLEEKYIVSKAWLKWDPEIAFVNQLRYKTASAK